MLFEPFSFQDLLGGLSLTSNSHSLFYIMNRSLIHIKALHTYFLLKWLGGPLINQQFTFTFLHHEQVNIKTLHTYFNNNPKRKSLKQV
jgi:hypothetical protein